MLKQKGGVNREVYSALFVKTAIVDSDGKTVVEYTYDACGNHKVSGSNNIQKACLQFLKGSPQQSVAQRALARTASIFGCKFGLF